MPKRMAAAKIASSPREGRMGVHSDRRRAPVRKDADREPLLDVQGDLRARPVGASAQAGRRPGLIGLEAVGAR